MRQKSDESTKKIQFADEFSSDCNYLMREMGLNISQLAEKLQISRAMLYAYRNGKKRITNRVWAKLRALKEEWDTRPRGVEKTILQKGEPPRTRIQERYILATLDELFRTARKAMQISEEKAISSIILQMLGEILDLEMRTEAFLKNITPILVNENATDLLRDSEFLSTHLELSKNFTLSLMNCSNNTDLENLIRFICLYNRAHLELQGKDGRPHVINPDSIIPKEANISIADK